MSKPVNSGIVIARILDTEGFTPHTAAAIRKWSRKRDAAGAHRLRRIEKTVAAFGEMMKRLQLSQGDRHILGKFITHREASAFESGLRIGMQVLITEGDQ